MHVGAVYVRSVGIVSELLVLMCVGVHKNIEQIYWSWHGTILAVNAYTKSRKPAATCDNHTHTHTQTSSSMLPWKPLYHGTMVCKASPGVIMKRIAC